MKKIRYARKDPTNYGRLCSGGPRGPVDRAMVRLAVFSSGSSSLGFALASHFIIDLKSMPKKLESTISAAVLVSALLSNAAPWHSHAGVACFLSTLPFPVPPFQGNPQP